MREWAGKRYWLVGASEGLGRSLAEVMSEAGIELILSARNEARLSELAETLPGRVDVKALDISDLDAVLAAKDEIGEIDGMVFLAGVYWPMPAQNLDPNKAEAMVDVNFTGAMRVVSAVLPEFVARDAGHILITGSLSAFRGLPGAVGYAASKAGTMV